MMLSRVVSVKNKDDHGLTRMNADQERSTTITTADFSAALRNDKQRTGNDKSIKYGDSGYARMTTCGVSGDGRAMEVGGVVI
jgi:hypothetical protein